MVGPDFDRLVAAGHLPDLTTAPILEPTSEIKHEIGRTADLLDLSTQPSSDVSERAYPPTKPLPIIKPEQIAGEL